MWVGGLKEMKEKRDASSLEILPATHEARAVHLAHGRPLEELSDSQDHDLVELNVEIAHVPYRAIDADMVRLVVSGIYTR